MTKYDIKRRTISEAVYQKCNPLGDPFRLKVPSNDYEWQLYGVGLGLYWGEGTKSNKTSVRLGNTDPELLRIFMAFLIVLCGVEKSRMRFGLQIFSDIDPQESLSYWQERLSVDASQFYKPIVTRSGSIGTYRRKNFYGVATLYFSNRKLRDILVAQVAALAQW